MKQEEWRPVPGFPGYSVSTSGRVWSCRSLRCLSAHKNHGGYFHVSLCAGGKVRIMDVHRIVLESFVGPCPPGMQAAHLDGRNDNNKPGNLTWATPKENARHRKLHGTQCRGETNGRSKLTERDVREIRAKYVRGSSSTGEVALGLEYGVSQATISSIILGTRWSHVR